MHRSKQHHYSIHLVGGREQHIRNVETKRFGTPEVDSQFELRRLHHGQVGRVCAFENFRRIYARLTIYIAKARCVAHQATGYDVFACVIHRWDRKIRGQRDDLLTPNQEERIGANKKRVTLLLNEVPECTIDLPRI